MVGELAALGAALIWGVGALLLKPLSVKFHPLILNQVRCSSAAVLLAVYLSVTAKSVNLSAVSVSPLLIATIGTFIGLGVGESLFVLSLRYIDLSRAYPIAVCTYPLITVAIAVTFLREEVHGMQLFGSLLVLAGLYFLIFPTGPLLVRVSLSSSTEKRGLILIGLAVFSWAVGTIAVKEGAEGMDLPLVNFVRLLGTSLLLSPFALLRRKSLGAKVHDWKNLFGAGISGVMSFGAGGLLFLLALERSGAAIASVLSSTSPLFLWPLAVCFFKERVTTKMAFGFFLSIVGIGFVFLSSIIRI